MLLHGDAHHHAERSVLHTMSNPPIPLIYPSGARNTWID
jgi:hypothetical protein